jgi:ketosteroid isomerase-like protein
MRSRYLFRKSAMPWYSHGRWLIVCMVVPVVVMYGVWAMDHQRDEWVWQAPIEPPGVTIVSHAFPEPVGKPEERELSQLKSISVERDSLDTTAKSLRTDAPVLPSDEAQVRQAIERWSVAWSSRDLPVYLDQYSKSFVPAGGQSRVDWEKTRHQRILSKKQINHDVRDLEIKVNSDTASAHFKQVYEADHARQVGTKTLLLKREDGNWRIYSESKN